MQPQTPPPPPSLPERHPRQEDRQMGITGCLDTNTTRAVPASSAGDRHQPGLSPSRIYARIRARETGGHGQLARAQTLAECKVTLHSIQVSDSPASRLFQQASRGVDLPGCRSCLDFWRPNRDDQCLVSRASPPKTADLRTPFEMAACGLSIDPFSSRAG
jgi:hypothetical protein